MQFPKPTRQTDEGFLDFVRGTRCASCGAPAPSDPNHLRTRGAGGSDYTAVAQCRPCHQKWHQLGPRKFREVTGVDLWMHNSQLLAEYFSQPEVVLIKALALIARPEFETTPEIEAILATLQVTLARRAA
jgi:hypothetical protein